MGYLQETLSTLREQRRTAHHAGGFPAWGEASRDEWLIAMPADFGVQRRAMVMALRTRLAPLADRFDRGAIDRALDAMATVPRERFVCPIADDLAYLPAPINIGHDQIMSHPENVAILAAAADPRGGDVLDVGTGSGYQASVLARMADTVTSIEIIAPLARLAAWRLAQGGFANVAVHTGDVVTHALAPHSFDAIVIAAGAADVPPVLLSALRPGGRLVMPIGATHDQEHLVLMRKDRSGAISPTILAPARAVPLTGAGSRAMA